jgi:hypothetical protein
VARALGVVSPASSFIFAVRDASPCWPWSCQPTYDGLVDILKVILSYDPPGPEFAITEECKMPTIKVTARLENAGPATPMAMAMPHQWKVNLVFTGANCKHSMNRRMEHPEINASTLTSTFTIPFTQIRGGDLTIEVSVRTGNSIGMATGRSQGLKVIGTNPSTAALLQAAIMTDAFKRLMRHESGLQQFRPRQCPYISRDNLGGVGICQITNPRPTDDQVWSWKENLKRGLELYKEKENVARSYPRRGRESKAFKDLVTAYNTARVAKSTAGIGLSNTTSSSLPRAGEAIRTTSKTSTDRPVSKCRKCAVQRSRSPSCWSRSRVPHARTRRHPRAATFMR